MIRKELKSIGIILELISHLRLLDRFTLKRFNAKKEKDNVQHMQETLLQKHGFYPISIMFKMTV